jgi:hypothetical protein
LYKIYQMFYHFRNDTISWSLFFNKTFFLSLKSVDLKNEKEILFIENRTNWGGFLWIFIEIQEYNNREWL